MNKKIRISFTIILVSLALLVSAIVGSSVFSQEPQQTLDFTVSGTNDCLRFLEPTVKTCYVPFKTGANERWRLTIECLKMPGSGGWTDLYTYKGYWDGAVNNICMSKDLYSILDQITPSGIRISTNSSFIQIYGGLTPASCTIFFIFPPGGQATYHVSLQRLD